MGKVNVKFVRNSLSTTDKELIKEDDMSFDFVNAIIKHQSRVVIDGNLYTYDNHMHDADNGGVILYLNPSSYPPPKIH